MNDGPSALYMTAQEAAATLSVSPATIYAYVSRGMIRSEASSDGRAKRYRADDVRALKDRRAPPEAPKGPEGRDDWTWKDLLSAMDTGGGAGQAGGDEPPLDDTLRADIADLGIDPAALAAVIAPDIVMTHGHLVETWRDARLFAAAAGVAFFFWRRGQGQVVLGTIAVGMAVYLPLHIGLGW